MSSEQEFAPIFNELFRFTYAKSDVERLRHCYDKMDIPSRRSLGAMSARFYMQKMDSLERKSRTEHWEEHGFFDSIYTCPNPLLQRIKKPFSFTGNTIEVPIEF